MRKADTFINKYHRTDVTTKGDIEVYELVINKDESYFYDVKKFRFYTFMENNCYDKNNDSG